MQSVHEAQTSGLSSFLTLTYRPGDEPYNGSVSVRDWQLFMKKLRKSRDFPLRFTMCGEYGDRTGRPHYHAAVFGEDFQGDRVFHKSGKHGDRIYRSDELDELWGHGHTYIGDVTFESAAYIARYIMKKQTGPNAEWYYADVIKPEQTIVEERAREFSISSNRPGLGHDWFMRYYRDVYPHDYVVVNGQKVRPPKYYDTLLERIDPEMMRRVRAKRSRLTESRVRENTLDRRVVREELAKRRMARLERETNG